MNQHQIEQRLEILRHPARWKVVVAGRRWGKTTLALQWLISGPIQPGELRWFVAPTYRQGKLIGWTILKRLFRQSKFPHKIAEAALDIVLPNTATISIKGADKADSLTGVGLGRVVMDEYADMNKDVWPEIIRPMLADTKGNAMFIGTPDGFNHFYDMYMQQETSKNYKSWQFKSIDGGFIEPEEIEDMRDLPEKTFRQEMEATFETVSTKAYYNFDRQIHINENAKYQQFLPILLSFDFNVNPMTAVLAHKQHNDITFFDEISILTSSTVEVCREFQRRHPEHRGGLIIYGDVTGRSRDTRSNKTDYDIIKEMLDHYPNFEIRVGRANPSIVNRVNITNGKMRDSVGGVHLFVSPKCKTLVNDWERVTFKENSRELDKSDHALTHKSDAADYLVWGEFGRKTAELIVR